MTASLWSRRRWCTFVVIPAVYFASFAFTRDFF